MKFIKLQVLYSLLAKLSKKEKKILYVAVTIISILFIDRLVVGTFDDNIFQSSGEIVSKISQIIDLAGSDLLKVTAICEKYLCVNSTVFMAKSVARIGSNPHSYEASAVIDRKKAKILYWREL